MTTALSTWGWRTWEEAVVLLIGEHGVWLGSAAVERPTDGWPTLMPPATRIFAWSPTPARMWRIVPDPSRALALVTCLASLDQLPAQPRETRAADVSTSAVGQWERHFVLGVAPIQFLRPSAAPAR